MKLFIAITDNDWFKYLSALKPDEVNFWRPSGGIFSLEIGTPFLFKLHSPFNYIAGGGFFIRSEKLPLTLAWDAFQTKNGVSTLDELRKKINSLRKISSLNPEIGCTILNEPFFLPEESWIQVPKSWSKNIVTGKSYDLTTSDGISLWNELQEKLMLVNNGLIKDRTKILREKRFGYTYLIKSRLGQGAFRLLVTGAYRRRCAFTGEKTLPALEAAHVKPFCEEGPNITENGLLMRSDFHKLFDKGYITVTPSYKIEVSKKIREEFENGRDYYAFHGNKLLILPSIREDMPNKEYLEWHNTNKFLG
ncbi:MAG: HNH endonuclease [candidate division Zixibacteria bacterium]|nr:HNH endonuclease [candidate division Zixibacteria bacterium]MDD5425158.1 HNH endonuclease [candidate division Zixibacteria bacterium]